MRIISRQQMLDLERWAIERKGIPSQALMENAGKAVADFIVQIKKSGKLKQYPSSQNPIVVVCGPGNNGGDGLVAARHLLDYLLPVEVFLLGLEEQLTGDAQANLHRLPIQVHPILNERMLRFHLDTFQNASILVDALFGTGLNRPLIGFSAALIQWLNTLPAHRIAIDLPSGLCADSGQALGEAIKADETLTLHLPKQGLLIGPDVDRVGTLQVAPIGIPFDLKTSQNKPVLQWIHPFDFPSLFKHRPKQSHKNTYGHVGVIAGSKNKIGAGILSSRAALRAGAGLVTYCLPECAYEKIDPQFSEIMFQPVRDDGIGFSEEAAQKVLEFVHRKSVLAYGPGIDTHQGAANILQLLLKQYRGVLVLDADALNLLSQNLTDLRETKAQLILTPHPKEMSRLSGWSIDYIQQNRLEVSKQFATKYGLYLVLKGDHTVVATPTGDLWINSTGNPGMATAGTGDVLTGIIAGLIAQKMPILEAVLAAVWLHGKTGDQAAQEKGEQGLLAGDLIEMLPSVIEASRSKPREIFERHGSNITVR